ncbi:hypothetical protein PUV54_14215 [Hyphococcus flavus]|uniref:Uncharacterized protein n=1 Tax=Hyphococcus flavus TaxID=1866326 RepID=A0AAF0CED2_9PROT|nr:hypothetical protein [Hyphococcus flavus]WDI31106.1 hypothetical protein PUV54_14215 [Hyphococcus flavus]
MTKFKKAIFIGAGATFLASAAVAGLYQPQVVDVDMAGGFAVGDMITARNDKDDTVFVGCGIRSLETSPTETFDFGFCQAADPDGEQVTCFSQNSELLDTIRASADASFVTFNFVDDGAGGFNCTRIGFSNQSFYLLDAKGKTK